MTDTPRRAALAERRTLLESQLTTTRSRTFRVTDALSDHDVHTQFDPLMSPIVWDMGHVGNFEEFWLLGKVEGVEAHDPVFDQLYNPFDNPRYERHNLPIMERDEATIYMKHVRGEALDALRRQELDPEDRLVAGGYIWSMIAQHEAQHQETVLQALDLRSDLAPYVAAASRRLPTSKATVDDAARVQIPSGAFPLGTDDTEYAYDNERPAHEVTVDAFVIDKYPTTVRRYAEFVDAGGYEREEYWTEDGRVWLSEGGHRAPQGWIPDLSGGWLVRRFGHVAALDPAEPVEHVNFHEAQAFARFAGARLPTEIEWEKAAAWDPQAKRTRKYPWGDTPPRPSQANLGHIGWGPAPVGSYPSGASAYGVEQMLGDGYAWTTSRFLGYPGFSVFPYPEYSEVFFGGDYRVLRGASWATSVPVARNTFRNWDVPIRRQIFAGIRLAWDV